VFLVTWQDMMKELGGIISEMEENMSCPMFSSRLCGSDFYKVIWQAGF
jgi:hypothetical protein